MKLAKGFFITIEGIDGSGKTTLAKNLYNYFSTIYPTILTKEPSETVVGKKIRAFLQEEVKISTKAEYLLFAADRAQHFNDTIVPSLNEKKIIISDRSGYSSLAYQGYGRGLDIKMINEINSWAMNNIEPDYIFYLKIDPTIGLERVNKRMEEISKFENLEFLKKVSNGFDAVFKNKNNVIILNANLPSDIILHQTIDFLKTKLEE